MDAWMSRARSAESRAFGEGNWNQEKGKNTTADRRQRTTVKDQRTKTKENIYRICRFLMYDIQTMKGGISMDKTKWLIVMFSIIICLMCGGAGHATPKIIVDANQTLTEISPTMIGIFFEDINFGADGGLYAELIKNRSFEFDWPLMGWNVIKKANADGRVLILRDENRPRNPRFARILLNEPGEGFLLNNEGFRGMGIKKGMEYRFQIDTRLVEGEFRHLKVELIDAVGNVLADKTVDGFSSQWKTLYCTLKSKSTEAKASLNIWIDGRGKLDIDMVSLFPTDTWNGRKNGLRADLVQLLADLKPGFLRFPGGCIVEGFNLSQRYQWKHTVGDPAERIWNICRWNFEFKHRPAPDYFQSYGLGFYEFFVLAEDLGAEPMPILNCGMACQFNTAELVPMDQIDPYVQDALDLIEFANGSADSGWGKIRAEMGHPKPFQMKMIGIGNEQWGPQYIERYQVFAQTIKDKYPDMNLIAATGSDATIFPDGPTEIEYLWSVWRKLKPEIVDEHFYRPPDWFLENVHYYDDYDREGPEIFVGEYAAQSAGVAQPNRNSWKCALYEAAFLIGLERNADLVKMSCYAPLFGNENAWQWRPDLIWFDNLNAYGSANYYVQQLFSLYKGKFLLPTSVEEAPKLDDSKTALHASATRDDSGYIIIKAVNASNRSVETYIDLRGLDRVGGDSRITLLKSDSLDDENSLQAPKKITPSESSLDISTPQFIYQFEPYSLTVIRIPVED
jgi:alpha-N-arabinofuranosidase